MALTASATTHVTATPQKVLEFVMNLQEYRKVDKKFVRVVSVTGPDANGIGSVKLWGRLKGMPPAPDRQDFVLERWERVTFTGARRQPARLVFGFVGTFVCEAQPDGGTKVTHSYTFRFRGPFRFIEPMLKSWLPRELSVEMTKLAQALTIEGYV
jgi:Polyketide cyclase / dehydrase and lipid transport